MTIGISTTDRGDVVSLLDASGTPLAAYRYDARGGEPPRCGEREYGGLEQEHGLIGNRTGAGGSSERLRLSVATAVGRHPRSALTASRTSAIASSKLGSGVTRSARLVSHWRLASLTMSGGKKSSTPAKTTSRTAHF